MRRPLAAPDAQAIDAAMERYAVLVFRDQPLTDEQQLAFTRHFGELERYETPGHIRKRDEHRLGPGISDFSNLTRDGALMSAEDRIWLFKLADRLWHSDSSFRPDSRQILPVVGEGDPVLGRRDRIRGHASSL